MTSDIEPFNTQPSSPVQTNDYTMNEQISESLPRNSQYSSSVPDLVRVVTTESRTGGAQWPKNMHRVKDLGSANQSIYLHGKSVRGSLGKFHAKGLVTNDSYASIEQHMLKNQRNNEHRSTVPVTSNTHKKQRMIRRLWKSIASFPVATKSAATAESSASMAPSEQSVAKVSGESTATKATAVTSEARLRNRSSQVTYRSSNSQSTTSPTTTSSNDPLLSRLFRAPIRKKPKKKSRGSATATGTTGKPKKSKKQPKTTKINRSPQLTTDTSVLSPIKPNDNFLISSTDNSENEGGIEDKSSASNTRHTLTGCPFIWSKKTKINNQAASSMNNTASLPAVAMTAQQKPPRQRISPSGLYLLVCVGLFCMPCLCVNYACHKDEEL
jgi:hypothetical protein